MADARRIPLLLLKAHNPGYTKKTGVYVAPFDDKRPRAPHAGTPPAKASVSLFDEPHKPQPPGAVPHPRTGEKGQKVMIHYPHQPTPEATWHMPGEVATCTPGSVLPAALHGVPFAPWKEAPKTREDWDYVTGQNDELEEPAMELQDKKVPASGVLVLEPDGRVWVISPTNGFGNTHATFPKGGRENGLSLQANAIKEAYEETGLQVEIDSFLGDLVRSTSIARYYLARRVGGMPSAMGWESQAVHLVPAGKLVEFVDRADDKKLAGWLTALQPGS